MTKIIKRYKNAVLTTCGSSEKKWSKESHLNGCYLKLKKDKVEYSRMYGSEEGMVVFDFSKRNELIGIEMVDGLPKVKRKKKW